MCFLEVYNFLFVVSDLINYICLRLKQNDVYKEVLWAFVEEIKIEMLPYLFLFSKYYCLSFLSAQECPQYVH